MSTNVCVISSSIFFLTLQIVKTVALPHWATCFSLSSKSQLIAVGSKGKLRCCIFMMHLHMGPVKKVDSSSGSLEHVCNSFLTVSNLLLERVLKLIKSTSGRFQDFVQHSDSLQTCHFSPSGTLLFTVAYNEILLWEVQGLWGPQIWTLNLKPCRFIPFTSA